MASMRYAGVFALAKQRWAEVNSFDLEDDTWHLLFQQHRPCDILQAIRYMRNTKDPDPGRRYQRFVRLLENLTAERRGFQ